MEITAIQNVYFLGIGGIGMSALARYFAYTGKQVAGYDRTSTALTRTLEEEGIAVHYQDDITAIPADWLPENTLVVLTPAIPQSHSEWNHLKAQGYTIKKRAEVLGIITRATYCFAVSGTHGKTTTSSILAHLLYQAQLDMTAFLGGIVTNYHSNWIGKGRTISVVEADEFDRSFLHLHPDVACVTSMDADHLDIYGDAETFRATFREFADKIPDKSKLFVSKGLELEGVVVAEQAPADVYAKNLQIVDHRYVFTAVIQGHEIPDLNFGLPGHHNLRNALMALAMAKSYGVADESLRTALASFQGVERRFAYQIQREDLTYIDDYAHHPTEINAVHQAVRELFPNEEIVAVFQPHLFSRTRDFLAGFAAALDQFDRVLLLDIYPARELPIEGVSSQVLLETMKNPRVELVSKADLVNKIKALQPRVLVTIGAGDIGEEVATIKAALS